MGAALTVTVRVCVPEPPALSVTWTPNVNEPIDGGVPVKVPPELSDSQEGSAGDTGDHTKPVFVPPDAERVCE